MFYVADSTGSGTPVRWAVGGGIVDGDVRSAVVAAGQNRGRQSFCNCLLFLVASLPFFINIS